MNKFVMVVAGLALVLGSVVQAQAAVVEKDKKIKMDYTLTVDGKDIDTSAGKKPIEFTAGAQQIVPGLEKALMGMKVGEEKTVNVPAAEAYGPPDPKAVQIVPKTLFPKDVTLKVGMVIPLQDKQGQTFPATVKEIQAEKVVLDFNHPLAGKDLTFKIKIVSIE